MIAETCSSGCRRFLGFILAVPCLLLAALPGRADDTAVRQTLCKAIAAEGPEQTQLVTSLATSNSDLVRKVLVAWLNDAVTRSMTGAGRRSR